MTAYFQNKQKKLIFVRRLWTLHGAVVGSVIKLEEIQSFTSITIAKDCHIAFGDRTIREKFIPALFFTNVLKNGIR